MIWNYLKVALRRMRREKTYAAISILSLAVGLAVSLLIGLNIYHELSWDDFHEKADRIYRVADRMGQGANASMTAIPPAPAGPALAEEFPQAKRFARLKPQSGATRRGGERFEERVLFVDSTFFGVFTFPLHAGSVEQVLTHPSSAVLSSEAAERLFGESDPVGKTLTVWIRNQQVEVRIEGVAEPVPSNSTIQFDVLVPFDRYAEIEERYGTGQWRGGGQIVTYLELQSAGSAARIQEALPEFARRHLPSAVQNMHEFSLEPLTSVHFRPGYYAALRPGRSMQYMFVVGGIGLVVLVLAAINFVTISLARSSDRYREVGIRKTLGAHRGQVAGQYWGETFLATLFGFVLAGVCAAMALPLFGRLVGKDLPIGLMAEPGFVLGALVLLLVLGLAAGSYPALVLSGPSPIVVFSGQGGDGRTPLVVRGLLVFQLALGAGLVAGVLVMNDQLAFIRSHDPGYESDKLVRVDLPSVDHADAGRTFAQLAERLPEVRSTAPQFSSLVGDRVQLGEHDIGVGIDGRRAKVRHASVATQFPETVGLEVLRGRSFQPAETQRAPEDALVNEAFVRTFDLANPIGTVGSGPSVIVDKFRIVGVVKDFHFQSLRHNIEPLVLLHDPTLPAITVYVQMATTDLPRAIESLRSVFQKIAPELPFDYHFVEELQDQQYRAEERWANLVWWASAIGLGLAGAGLFGLALMAARRREKEISIRKVLGATVTAIVGLFSRDFLKMAVLGVLIGLPAAYLVFNRWLSEFAYRIELGPGPFLWATGGTLFLVWVSVSYQSIRAALVNPAATLRNE